MPSEMDRKLEGLFNTTKHYLENELFPSHFKNMKLGAIASIRQIISDSMET